METQTYQLTAYVQDFCVATASLNVVVKKERIVYIPNIFSPNGDGKNDRFLIYGNPAEITAVRVLRVFDRWGELIFEHKDFQVNAFEAGWDGCFRNEPMNPTVFVYYTEIEFIDGKRELFKGDVLLLR